MREYGTGTYSQLPSGKWRGRVSTPDGRRVSATRDTEEALRKELRRLAGKVAGGEPVASTVHTVNSWLRVWLEESRPNLAPRTHASYASYAALYIAPVLGKHKLTALRPEHVNQMTRRITDQGLSGATALKARAILRRALKVAHRYGHVAGNVADLTDPPKQTAPDRPALTGDQARAVLAAAAGHRLQARYATALYLGLRQGELLGLRWQDVDLDTGLLTVAQQLQRITWRHGCGPGCGAPRAADCPQRHGGGLVPRAPKSAAGRRTIPLPAPLLADLRAHRRRQAAEQLAAGPLWQHSGMVFTQHDGRPIDPAADLKGWRRMLTAAGVPPVGTHAARRTCATLLLGAGVDAKIVAAVIGHTSVALTQDVYQQTNLALLTVATAAIGEVLRPAPVLVGLDDARRRLGLRNAAALRDLIATGDLRVVERSGRRYVTEESMAAWGAAQQADMAALDASGSDLLRSLSDG